MRRETKHLYGFDDFQLDGEKLRLTRGGETIQLPPKAIELLVLLVEYRGQILEKDFLMERVWRETFVEEANLTQNIYLLRKALGKTTEGKPFIETLPKRGYKFTPEVSLLASEPAPLVVSKITNIHARITEYEEDEKQNSEKAEKTKRRLSPWLLYSLSPLLLLIIGAAVYFGFSGQNRKSNQVKSIAVLPFKTIGATAQQEEILGLGMADAVITRLGATGKIAVSPTDAVRRSSEKDSEPFAIARSLGTEAVLTGNIQRDGDRFRVTVQLVRVGENQPLWSDGFEEKTSDVFALQNSISSRLAAALELKLTGDEQQKLTPKNAPSAEAYNFYLEGRAHFARRTVESVGKAIECFEQAARLAPEFAEAYAGLAGAYAVSASGLPPQERFPKAKAAARRALELNENLADAHTSLGFILYKSEWNWLEAETHFRRALEINPSYAQAHHWFGEMLGLQTRFDEGLNFLREAERLDPLSPAIKTDLANVLYRARRYDEAVEKAQQALNIKPDFRNAFNTLMRSFQQKEMYREAVEADLESLRLSNYPPDKIEELRKIFAESGWQSYWQRQIEIQQVQNRVEYVPSYQFIEICLRLGETEKALEMLEKSFDERGDAPLYLRSEPPLDVLRSNARFQYLVRRTGLTAPGL